MQSIVLKSRVYDTVVWMMAVGTDTTVGELMHSVASTNRAAVTQLVYYYCEFGFLKPYVSNGDHGYVMTFRRTSKQEQSSTLESQSEYTHNE